MSDTTMPKQLKIEIKILDGEWQWLGKLTSGQLLRLCDYADKLNSGDLDNA